MQDSSTILRIIGWLLDLENIRFGSDEPLALHFQAAPPLWVLAPAGALVLLWIGMAYRRERGGPVARGALAGLRFGIIALVVAVLCQPVLRLQRERIEPSHVALLIDRSRSMAQIDAKGDSGKTQRAVASEPSRIDSLRAALTNDDDEALRAMMAHNRLVVYTFASTVHHEAAIDSPDQLPAVTAVLDEIACDGAATDVAGAVQDVIRRAENGTLAALVLATDGRTTDANGIATIDSAVRVARAHRVPIYVIPVGSPIGRCDVFVDTVSAQERAFVKDFVAVKARIGFRGLPDSTPPTTAVTVQLVDVQRNVVVDSKTVDWPTLASDSQTDRADDGAESNVAFRAVELSFKPTVPGPIDHRIEIVPLAEETDQENNRSQIRVRVRDERLHVLFVEGYPRYEYRYLKNALLREPTIRSSCLLLSADQNFAQEGTDPIRRFPVDLDELDAYDLVIFGDLDPSDDWLTAAQAEMLVEYVGRRGGGFALIAGHRDSPRAFRGTELEKLIPVRIDPAFLGEYTQPLEHSFQPRLTVEGRHHRLFRFLQTQELDSNTVGAAPPIAVDVLPQVYWIAATLGPKPGAQVLAVHPRLEARSGPMPIMVMGRYGAGRVFFTAIDETWRWRRGQNEWSFDTFWLQVCRALARPIEMGAERRVTLRTDRKRYAYGRRVQVVLNALDASVLPLLGDSVNVLVSDPGGDVSSRVALWRLGKTSHRFEGSFVPAHAGSFVVDLEDMSPLSGPLRAARISTMIHVDDADLEMKQPQADHAALRMLAEQTGGSVIGLSEIADKVKAIQDRSTRIPNDLEEPLWDSRLVLTLFVLMIGTEWVLRKAFGML